MINYFPLNVEKVIIDKKVLTFECFHWEWHGFNFMCLSHYVECKYPRMTRNKKKEILVFIKIENGDYYGLDLVQIPKENMYKFTCHKVRKLPKDFYVVLLLCANLKKILILE